MSTGRWKHVQPCGTHAAYQRHIRHGEVPCPECTAAHRNYRDANGINRIRRRHSDRLEREASIQADLRELIAALARLFEEEAA